MNQPCWPGGKGRDTQKFNELASLSRQNAELPSRSVELGIWSAESGRPAPCQVLWSDWATAGSADEQYLRLEFTAGCHCSRDSVCQGLTMVTVSPTLLFHCSLIPNVEVLQT